MFHYVRDLQFNASVSYADLRFAGLLLGQFGGGKCEPAAEATDNSSAGS
jgi:Mn-containing catalase